MQDCEVAGFVPEQVVEDEQTALEGLPAVHVTLRVCVQELEQLLHEPVVHVAVPQLVQLVQDCEVAGLVPEQFELATTFPLPSSQLTLRACEPAPQVVEHDPQEPVTQE